MAGGWPPIGGLTWPRSSPTLPSAWRQLATLASLPDLYSTMSLFCAISGQAPLHPVLSVTSGQVYEKDLVLKYLKDNDGRDPITGEALTEDQLIPIKTGPYTFPSLRSRCPSADTAYEPRSAPSTPSAAPRPPSFTSVPALLHVLQGEWDACMLEMLEMRKQGSELRQELSHALYKEDAAMRVLARVSRERDEARECVSESFANGWGSNEG